MVPVWGNVVLGGESFCCSMPPEPRLSQIGIPETFWADGKEVIKQKP